jgi:S1-C subfamily serine protease
MSDGPWPAAGGSGAPGNGDLAVPPPGSDGPAAHSDITVSPPEAPPAPPPAPRLSWRAKWQLVGGRKLLVFVVVMAVAIGLASAAAGGLVGGYLAYRASGHLSDPDFSFGTVPPALRNRAPASVAGIAARVLPSVVMIKVDDGAATGSGFIINGGYVITDNHVVTEDGRVDHASLRVVLNGGRSLPAKLVGTDPFSDIAVILPRDTAGLPALTLGNSAAVEVGDPVIAVGSPLGLAGTVTSGIVSAVGRPVQPSGEQGAAAQSFINAIQTDAPINPGNSGGPLVNSQAQVIGVNAAIATLGGDPLAGIQAGSIGLGFAIPVNQARLIATEIIRTGKASHAIIGAALNTAYTGKGAQIARPARRDAHPVTPAGPAARAGLRPGDVVIRFAGQPIGSAAALIEAIRLRQPGARVAVTYRRGDAVHTTTLTLGAATS